MEITIYFRAQGLGRTSSTPSNCKHYIVPLRVVWVGVVNIKSMKAVGKREQKAYEAFVMSYLYDALDFTCIFQSLDGTPTFQKSPDIPEQIWSCMYGSFDSAVSMSASDSCHKPQKVLSQNQDETT